MKTEQPLVRVNAATIKAKKAARAPQTNKSDFVRAHPKHSAIEIVALAAKQGLRLSKSLVYEVRKGGLTATKRGRVTPPTGVQASPVKRGPARPRKQAAQPAAPAGRRGHGRPRKHPVAVLTPNERQLVALFLQVGVARSEELLGSFKQALGA